MRYSWRYAPTILATLTLAGCIRDDWPGVPTAPATPQAPHAPSPASSVDGALWGMVVDPAIGCIRGATVRVVRDGVPGESFAQETPCNPWDYVGGFVVRPLPPGPATVVASAPGYVAKQVTVTVPAPSPHGPWQWTAAVIELTPE